MLEEDSVGWEHKYDAPDGKTWVCGACGRNGKNSTTIGDESCFLNAVLCYADKRDGNWVVVDTKDP